ncbi:MAG TPA: hypothetical protein VFA15_01200, partial [Nitrososphaera sp.]|nr:hypothetical protein [Nitrososphaera sp.]
FKIEPGKSLLAKALLLIEKHAAWEGIRDRARAGRPSAPADDHAIEKGIAAGDQRRKATKSGGARS